MSPIEQVSSKGLDITEIQLESNVKATTISDAALIEIAGQNAQRQMQPALTPHPA